MVNLLEKFRDDLEILSLESLEDVSSFRGFLKKNLSSRELTTGTKEED